MPGLPRLMSASCIIELAPALVFLSHSGAMGTLTQLSDVLVSALMGDGKSGRRVRRRQKRSTSSGILALLMGGKRDSSWTLPGESVSVQTPVGRWWHTDESSRFRLDAGTVPICVQPLGQSAIYSSSVHFRQPDPGALLTAWVRRARTRRVRLLVTSTTRSESRHMWRHKLAETE